MITQIFGTNNALLYPYVQLILKENIGKKYFFINEEEWKLRMDESINQGNKIFWLELQNRVHFCSITNLLRTQKWIDALTLSFENQNLLSFCTSMRGLIEFATDSYYTFAAIPYHLADIFSEIESIFDTEKKEIVINQALEDALLHYTFAGKHRKKDNRSKIYNAKQIKDYIKYADESGKIQALYEHLSGFTHPSTESVTSFLKIQKHEIGEYLEVIDQDEETILKLVKNNQKLFDNILCLSIYPSLFNLKILSMFKIENFKSKSINSLNFDQLTIWKDIKSKIK